MVDGKSMAATRVKPSSSNEANLTLSWKKCARPVTKITIRRLVELSCGFLVEITGDRTGKEFGSNLWKVESSTNHQFLGLVLVGLLCECSVFFPTFYKFDKEHPLLCFKNATFHHPLC